MVIDKLFQRDQAKDEEWQRLREEFSTAPLDGTWFGTRDWERDQMGASLAEIDRIGRVNRCISQITARKARAEEFRKTKPRRKHEDL